MTATQELQVKEKHEVASPAEQIRPGLIFTPDVDIFETDFKITLLSDMPGVAADDIEIDLRDNILTIAGDVKPFEEADESDILIEFEVGKYHRQFTLSDKIDQNKIEANFEDGVLRLTLPKEEKAAPRKITVKSA